jgi:glycosyltransferase involved in cell wall biosynthesis
VLLALEPPDGGVAENVVQLALHLPAHGWDVDVAGPPDAVIYPRLEPAGVRAHRLPFGREFSDPRRELRALRALARLLRRGRYDLLHCHSAKAGALGRLGAWRAGVPAVYSPHALPFVGPSSARRRVGAWAAERALAPLTARILCVSEHERRAAAAARLGGRGRLRVVPNACAPCDASVAVDPRLDALRGGGPVAGAVAVLRRQKRLDLLLDAAPDVLRRVPDARIAVVGNGPLQAELHAQAERLGLAAHPRFGLLPFAAPVERYLRGLDVFVLPSDWEGLPIAVLEALACGVPQVATEVGGTREAVTPETGVLVPPGDPRALADALVSLLQDPERRARMAEASRLRHAAAFTLERMVAMTASVYREALAAGAPLRAGAPARSNRAGVEA